MSNVTQTEYDVTAYRNVLDQLKTLQDRMDSLYDGLRYYLAAPDMIASTHERSGWAMKEYGGKSRTRWSEKVGPEIGLGKLKYGNWPSNMVAPTFHHTDMRKIESFRKKVKPNFRVTDSSLRRQVYDILSLTRNLQWELNRLRIQMPYDLRQLTAQLNRHASDFGRVVRTVNKSGTGRGSHRSAKIKDATAVFVVFREVKKFKKQWLPKMLSKIRDRIREADLAEKVAEKNQRREKERTRKAKEKQTTQKQGSGTVSQDAKQTRDKGAEQERLAKIIREQMKRVQKDRAEMTTMNNKELNKQAKNEGDTTGDGKGGAVALGALALLALAGGG